MVAIKRSTNAPILILNQSSGFSQGWSKYATMREPMATRAIIPSTKSTIRPMNHFMARYSLRSKIGRGDGQPTCGRYWLARPRLLLLSFRRCSSSFATAEEVLAQLQGVGLVLEAPHLFQELEKPWTVWSNKGCFLQ